MLRPFFRKPFAITLLACVLLSVLGFAYWHYQTRRIEARAVEVGHWVAYGVVKTNPVKLEEVVGGTRVWSGSTPLFCCLRTSAGKKVIIEVWIDSALFDAKITRVRCRMAGPVLPGEDARELELSPDVVTGRQSVDLQEMFPDAFTD